MKQILNTKEVAEMLGLSFRTVQKWRWKGSGPKYTRQGGMVRYQRGDVISWMDANAVQPGEGE